MITEKEKKIICKIAKKYNVARLYLFGSSLLPEGESEDIDLAVEGLDESKFFKFYSELLFDLPRPVDLIDLSSSSGFREIVLSEGLLLHG